MLYKIRLISALFLLISVTSLQVFLIDNYAHGSSDESYPKNDDNYNDIIKNNFLTYTNQTLNFMLKYPDFWSISVIGNDTIAILPPINASGILINKLNLQDLDQFLYERINLQKKSLDGFQLIESNNISFKDNNASMVLMY